MPRHLLIALFACTLLASAVSGCVREAPIEGAACNGEHRCPGGFACAAGACRKLDARPIARCSEDDECMVGVCLEAAGFCVQCERDADCGQAACIAGLYVCGCRSDDQCDTGRCNSDTGACVSCLAGEQCRSGRCDIEHGVCDTIEKDREDAAKAQGGTR